MEDYKIFKKENRLALFGHEDAAKEKKDRLTSYYYRTSQYEDMMSNIDLQVVIGEKGTGKSALLKMAYIDSDNVECVPIWIRLDDISELYSDILVESDLHKLKTLWKRAISKVVVMKLASSLSFIANDDYEKALEWAYSTGYKNIDFISKTAKLLKPMYEKYIATENEQTTQGEHRILERMIKNKKLRIFLDDFDMEWSGNKLDIVRIQSLFLSLSDMTSDMEGLSARIALRTDVYDIIRNKEFSDKFESSIIKCQWDNLEIMIALAKRISSYYELEFDETQFEDPSIAQHNLNQYFDMVFEPSFGNNTRIWKNAPTHRVIYSLIRRKPRDMVKLCHSVAEEAYKLRLPKINATCFLNILERYSQERLRDLINEYSRQMPALESLLNKMAPTSKEREQKSKERYVYTTPQLYEKIKNVMSTVRITLFCEGFNTPQQTDVHDIAHFLYKIGFITGRKRQSSGKIQRRYYDEAPNLLKKHVGDLGFSWEIHPAYRGALANGISDNWETTIDDIEDGIEATN